MCSVTEQPFKIPFYAALLCHLYEPVEGMEGASIGAQVLEDFTKGFRAFLDKLAWREVRLCVSTPTRKSVLLTNREYRFNSLHT